MQLNQHHIPEMRLYPGCINDLKSIYDAVGSEPASTVDVAKMLGYSSNTTGAFYRRLESLDAYGLIQRHGKVRVSALGKRVTYPEGENDRKTALKEAILHVSLWSEIYKKFGKNIPAENFWVQIKNITGIEAPAAQKVESVIRKWYVEDMAQVSDEIAQAPQSADTKGSKEYGQSGIPVISSNEMPENILCRLSAPGIGTIEITDEDTLMLARATLDIIKKKIDASRMKTNTVESTTIQLNPLPSES